MPWRALLVPQLPYLRRYARAVTGSQVQGDEAVRGLLEAFLESQQEFDTASPPKEELFRVFHRHWRAPAASTKGKQAAPTATLAPTERQALLLSTVEGFSVPEVARILDVAPEEAAGLIERAYAAIATVLRGKVMIVEDEAIIALHLSSLVEDAGHTPCGIARTHGEATELARRTEPELVLADIQLADGSSGIDAVQEILATMDVPVIFVTAFPEKLLTGTRPEPTYLITKPFEDETLVAMIGQALMFHRESRGLDLEEAA